MPSEEHARRVVDAYAKGVICSGEVFNQYVDQLTEDTLDTYMAQLSPELITRFQQNLEATDVERPFAKPDDITRWRRAEALIAGWIRSRCSEQSGST